jgi:peptide/nickel transport system substrate-binding protein
VAPERDSIDRLVRIVAIAVAALAAVTLSATAASGGASQKDGGTFRVALTVTDFQAMDPALTGLEDRLLRPTCAGLMSYPNKPLPAGLRLAPELAEAHPRLSGDRRTYAFTIQRGARFSNGTTVTAGAFVRALERIFDPRTKSFKALMFESIVGAREMLAGKAVTLSGAVAAGRTLRLRLTKPVPDFLARLTLLCAVPENLPVDPEGAKAPLHSPAPYYVSEYVPGERLVMARNRFYRGERPRHLDRIEVDLQAGPEAIEDVASGKLDLVPGTPNLNPRLAGLVRRYGVNRGQVFVEPDVSVRMFFLNTSRPLFRNNVRLRQAVNLAADRRALVREYGQYAATSTDQYVPSALPGFRDERIYPLRGPDLRTARALARGRTRSGRAVLYTCSDRPDGVAVAQILQRNLKPIGLEIEIKQFPLQVMFQRLATPGEPYDITWVGLLHPWVDPQTFLGAFDGRTIGSPDGANFSRFDSPRYDRLLDRASRLSGPARYRAFGEIDVQLARDAAPAIAAMIPNTWAFVSARTGCVVMNPSLDVTALCLK